MKYFIITTLKFAEEIRECRKVVDFLLIIVLEDAKCEENHELNSTIVFSHTLDESLRSYFRLQKNMIWSI